MTGCRVAECTCPHKAKGLCGKHYRRLQRTGDPEGLRPFNGHPLAHPVLAFTSRVGDTTPGGCWSWVGKIDHNGYPTMSVNRKPYMAHVYAYELLIGEKPVGMHLDHVCHTRDAACMGGRRCPHRSCVNPAHLQPVSPLVNALRSRSFAGLNGRKTHCSRGHLYDEDNTQIINKSGRRPYRRCRACSAVAQRRNRSAARARAAS